MLVGLGLLVGMIDTNMVGRLISLVLAWWLVEIYVTWIMVMMVVS